MDYTVNVNYTVQILICIDFDEIINEQLCFLFSDELNEFQKKDKALHHFKQPVFPILIPADQVKVCQWLIGLIYKHTHLRSLGDLLRKKSHICFHDVLTSIMQ